MDSSREVIKSCKKKLKLEGEIGKKTRIGKKQKNTVFKRAKTNRDNDIYRREPIKIYTRQVREEVTSSEDSPTRVRNRCFKKGTNKSKEQMFQERYTTHCSCLQ